MKAPIGANPVVRGVPGPSLEHKDLYLLTSHDTFSAPYAFAYDMQAVGRAKGGRSYGRGSPREALGAFRQFASNLAPFQLHLFAQIATIFRSPFVCQR